MKLWKNDGPEINSLIEAFTIGKDPEFDMLLAPYDILGSIAHARMLGETSIIDTETAQLLENELRKLYQKSLAGALTIEEGVEDIHSQVEQELVQILGTVGKKLHSGRSRNDQVLLDIKLFLRDKLSATIDQLVALFELLILQANANKQHGLPGYTHLQVAMPSSFGLWFSAYAESLIDDLTIAQSAFININQNPLGSAAGYGSAFPINRQITTDLLGFPELHINVVHAQLQRGKSELNYAYFLSSIANTINKLAYDICLYNSQNYGFISLPDDLVTGSSIMPHKRNPDVFELIRAHTSIIQQLPAQMIALITNLPSGYHRDLQLTKEVLFPAVDKMQQILDILIYSIPKIQIEKNILSSNLYQQAYSVDAIYKRTNEGVAFRDAYHEISAKIKSGEALDTAVYPQTLIGSKDNLALDRIKFKMQERLKRLDHKSYRAIMMNLIKD